MLRLYLLEQPPEKNAHSMHYAFISGFKQDGRVLCFDESQRFSEVIQPSGALLLVCQEIDK